MRQKMFRRDPAAWGRGRGFKLGPWIGLLTAGTLAAVVVLMPHEKPPAPVVTHARPLAAQAAPEKLVISDFDREMAMGPNELMKRWEPLVSEASNRVHVPPEWIRAVITMESGGRTLMGENVPITSDMGAMGIMQVLPQTYADMRAQYGLGADPYDPHDNVIAGTAYLKFLYGKYGNPAMFAAYNDGPGNLEAFLGNARELPDETHHYVDSISRMLGQPASQFGRVTAVQFTRPDGTPIDIDTKSVSGVRAAFPGEYAPGVQAVISAGKTNQGVREDAAAVTALLKAHGAKL